MKLSAPIYVLKNQAKLLKKSKSITQAEALNEIAIREGYTSWSLLMCKFENILPQAYSEISDFLNPGDLVIIGSRPGFGKTTFCVGLFVQVIKKRLSKNYFFSLSETHMKIADTIASYDESIGEDTNIFELNYSNEICASYIIEYTKNQIKRGSLIVVDYLQLLDEKRDNPSLEEQIVSLKKFAKENGVIIIFISQIDRKVEYTPSKKPSVLDLRLPNPLNLNHFNKILLLHKNKKEENDREVILCGKTIGSFFVKWDGKKFTS